LFFKITYTEGSPELSTMTTHATKEKKPTGNIRISDSENDYHNVGLRNLERPLTSSERNNSERRKKDNPEVINIDDDLDEKEVS